MSTEEAIDRLNDTMINILSELVMAQHDRKAKILSDAKIQDRKHA